MSKITYLPSAGRRCTDCNCKKAVPAALMRRQPEKYFFTVTEDCGTCGDRIEVDDPSLEEALAEQQAWMGTCKDCGSSKNLARCEVEVPGSGRVTRVTLCFECIGAIDERTQDGDMPAGIMPPLCRFALQR